MRRAIILIAALTATIAVAQTPRPLPYWASLSAGDALLRTGPGREYPAAWRYARVDLPLKVIATHASWRKVREMDGTEGWMASVLLSDRRTAMVTGAIRPLRAAPDAGAKIVWQAEPGVIGKIAHCRGGWCEFDVHGRAGYIETSGIWGVAPGETID